MTGKTKGVCMAQAEFENKEQVFEEICMRIAKGETLLSVCRDVHMPNASSVYDWMKRDAEYAQRFADARQKGFDAIAEECFAIADDTTRDYVVTEKGKELDREHVQRSKLRVWTRLQLLAKWDPKRYGERQAIEHSGSVDVAQTIVAARKRAGQ